MPKLEAKDTLHVSDIKPVSKTASSHLPCKYCGSEVNKSSGCPHVSTCLPHKTNIHSPHYICPLLQNPGNQCKDEKLISWMTLPMVTLE